jgi:hypothetical protein
MRVALVGLLVLVALALTSCFRTANPPVVVIQTPTSGSTHLVGAAISFSGTAVDVVEGNLTGDALVWTSSLDGEIGRGQAFTRSDLREGVHTITLSATSTRGATGSTSILINVAVSSAPMVAIDAPVEDATFARGAPITFSGEAQDAEDGTLIGASLVWISSLDGQIGTGTSFIRTSLSVGAHVITLTATDSDALTGTATITIQVVATLPGTCYVYSIPDAGGQIAIEMPNADEEVLYMLTVSWEGPVLGAMNPGMFWSVTYTQAANGDWIAGPAISIAGVTISDGSGTNGNSTSTDILGGGQTVSGNEFALRDDVTGVESDPNWWTFDLDNSNPAEQFSNVKLYVFPAAAIEAQPFDALLRSIQ